MGKLLVTGEQKAKRTPLRRRGQQRRGTVTTTRCTTYLAI